MILAALFQANVRAENDVPAEISAVSASYALPRTVICIKVTGTHTVHHAGKYARFADKLYEAFPDRNFDEIATESSSEFRITETNLSYSIESNGSQRFTLSSELAKNGIFENGPYGTLALKGGKKPVSGSVTDKPSSLKPDRKEIADRSDKQAEAKVDEIIAKIDEVSRHRYDITIGNTDATYSGEALGAAISELTRMEKELVSLFAGYDREETVTSHFYIVPANDSRSIPVFCIDNEKGLVKAEGKKGEKAYTLSLATEVPSEPEGLQEKSQSNQTCIYTMVPAVCDAVLNDAAGLSVAELRLPVFQMGLIEKQSITKQ